METEKKSINRYVELYDAIQEKGSRSYFSLKKGALVGLANYKGKQILDPLYSKIKVKNFTPRELGKVELTPI